MIGHLKLVCSRREDGVSYLREQSFRAPMHLSKPHFDEGALVVNLVNPTAGIFDDDHISLEATVEEDARLVLTTPASSRVFRSRKGDVAHVTQTLRVAERGMLEYFPEPFIPHAGARYHQKNDIHVAPGASLLFFEWLAPGRVTSGEVFEFDELQWDTDVWSAGVLAARERYTLSRVGDSLNSLRLVSETAHYLGCFVFGLAEFPRTEVDALTSEDVYIGCGPLAVGGGWTIKAVCKDAVSSRRTMKRLREMLYEAMGRPAPTLGRF
jgi:urease accessory protein